MTRDDGPSTEMVGVIDKVWDNRGEGKGVALEISGQRYFVSKFVDGLMDHALTFMEGDTIDFTFSVNGRYKNVNSITGYEPPEGQPEPPGMEPPPHTGGTDTAAAVLMGELAGLRQLLERIDVNILTLLSAVGRQGGAAEPPKDDGAPF